MTAVLGHILGGLALGKGGSGSSSQLWPQNHTAEWGTERVDWDGAAGPGSQRVLSQNAKFSSLNKNHPNPQSPEVNNRKWKTTTNKLLWAAVPLDFKRSRTA